MTWMLRIDCRSHLFKTLPIAQAADKNAAESMPEQKRTKLRNYVGSGQVGATLEKKWRSSKVWDEFAQKKQIMERPARIPVEDQATRRGRARGDGNHGRQF